MKEYTDLIDEKTFFVPFQGDNSSIMKELYTIIKAQIKKYGFETVYVGKTSDPYNRMTGKKDSKKVFEEKGILIESKSHIPAHNKPHLQNDYKKMFILSQFKSKKDVDMHERALIDENYDNLRNKSRGGSGMDGGTPYFLYFVVHEGGFNHKTSE